jgi:hypothetical protein
MKHPSRHAPSPLSVDSDDRAEARAARLLRAADSGEPSPWLLERLRGVALSSTPAHARRWRPALGRACSAGALLMAPLVAAAVFTFVPKPWRAAQPPPPAITRARPPLASAAPASEEAQTAAPEVHPPDGARRASAPRGARAGPTPAPSAGPSEFALESRALGAALEALRHQGDAAGALFLLDAYVARFPRGVLRNEEALARVEALLALARHDEALAVLNELDQRHFEGVPRAEDMRLLRAELLAQSGDCPKASPVFDAFVKTAAGEALERALYGRASCRLAAHQEAAAQVDFARYLAEFPNGRFAEAARRALARPL